MSEKIDENEDVKYNKYTYLKNAGRQSAKPFGKIGDSFMTESKATGLWEESQKASVAGVRKWICAQYDSQPLAYVRTYGCQQNVSDGEKIKGMLALMGYGFCETVEEADLIIFNTCAVRENAEDRVFGNVGALKHQKRRNPNLIIGLCGCMMQQEHIAERIKNSFPYVDLVFGPHSLPKLPELLEASLNTKKRIFDLSENNVGIIEGIPIRRDQEIRAWLPIMYGCNNFCTYCVVPYVRGRERSRRSEEILQEFKGLLQAGYKEVMLLGQNVNSYGKGLEEEINFSGLLRKLNAVEGEFRIRFMSSHPKDATFELIDTIAECEKVCKHFHLPVQCGSDRILKQMNRQYTRADYCRLVDYAREKMPDIAFTSDFIVGFPGETEEDFSQTLELLERVRFDSIFSFIYSKRKGTKAAEMEDFTSDEEKADRFQRMLDLQKQIGIEKYESCIGKRFRVLVEGQGRSGTNYLTGRNEAYMIIDFPGPLELVGQFVEVEITEALNWALRGELVLSQDKMGEKK